MNVLVEIADISRVNTYPEILIALHDFFKIVLLSLHTSYFYLIRLFIMSVDLWVFLATRNDNHRDLLVLLVLLLPRRRVVVIAVDRRYVVELNLRLILIDLIHLERNFRVESIVERIPI